MYLVGFCCGNRNTTSFVIVNVDTNIWPAECFGAEQPWLDLPEWLRRHQTVRQWAGPGERQALLPGEGGGREEGVKRELGGRREEGVRV